jgi:hypothetical protein
MIDKKTGMCYRCEWRALFLETGIAPRSECSTVGNYGGCYMYKPTKPLILKQQKGDKIPAFGPAIISSRMDVVGIDDMQCILRKDRNGYLAYWVPKNVKVVPFSKKSAFKEEK